MGRMMIVFRISFTVLAIAVATATYSQSSFAFQRNNEPEAAAVTDKKLDVPSTRESQLELARSHYKSLNYEKSKQILYRLIERTENLVGSISSEVWEQKFVLASVHADSGQFQTAFDLFDRIAIEASQATKVDYECVGRYRYHAACMRLWLGDSEGGKAMLFDAWDDYKNLDSPSAELPQCINQIARLQISQRDIEAAIVTNERAAMVVKQLLSSSRANDNNVLFAKAEVLKTQGSLSRQKGLMLRRIEKNEDADLLFAKSIKSLDEAEKILEGLGRIDYQAECVKLRAWTHKSTNNLEAAITDARKSIELFEASTRTENGKLGPAYVVYLETLVDVLIQRAAKLRRSGDDIGSLLSEAEDWTNQALQIGIGEQGNQHPWMVRFYRNLATINRLRKDISRAREAYFKAFEMQYRQAEDSFLVLDEFQLFKATVLMREDAAAPIEISARTADGPTIISIYDRVWQNKGLISRLVKQRTIAFKRLAATQDRDILSERQKLRTELSNKVLQLAFDGKGAIKEYQKLNAILNKQNLKMAVDGNLKAHAVSAPLKRLEELLPTDIAIIDIVGQWRKPGRRFDPISKYYAFVLTRDSEKPLDCKLIVLDRAQIDPLVIQWLENLEIAGGAGHVKRIAPDIEPIEKVEPISLDIAQKLKQLVWDRIKSELGGRRKVILVGDAYLAKMPWVALPADAHDSKFLIEEYQISHAANAHMLLEGFQQEPSNHKIESLLTIAEIDYNESHAWTSLNTKPEADSIVSTVNQHFPNSKVTRLGVNRATPEKVLQQIANHSHIVISTHGFCMSPRNRQFPGLNPFMLSGIVLSRSENSNADRYLTGWEIIDADLGNPELVVLSACVTGKGKIMDGDGLFGIQQALHWSGAKSTLASRWQLADELATEFTSTFFKHLCSGKSNAESLQETMKDRIATGEPHRYWASWKDAGNDTGKAFFHVELKDCSSIVLRSADLRE